MTVVAGTVAAGSKTITDVSVDSVSDRNVALIKSFGPVSSWTVSSGDIVEIKDGAECLEISIEVEGPFNSTTRLLGGGGEILSTTGYFQVPAGSKARVKFKLARNHRRSRALSGPAPAVVTDKYASAFLSATATAAATAEADYLTTVAMTAGATMIAQAGVNNNLLADVSSAAVMTASPGVIRRGGSEMLAVAMATALGTTSKQASSRIRASATMAASAE